MSSSLNVKKTALWEKVAILCVIFFSMVFEAKAENASATLASGLASKETTFSSSEPNSVAHNDILAESDSLPGTTLETVALPDNAEETVSSSPSSATSVDTESVKPPLALSVSPASKARGELGVIQPLLALVVVFGVMFFIAWLLKKGKLIRSLPKGILKQIAVLPMGGKESVAIIECGETWLVVGITAHQMTLLHTLSKKDLPETQVENHDIPFKKWLETTAERLRSPRSS